MSDFNDIEIIIYDYKYFLSIKNKIVIDETDNFFNKVKININQLFDSNYRDNYAQKVITFYNNFNTNKENNSNVCLKKKKHKDKRIELFSLLNKITETNYNTILIEIKKILFLDNQVFINTIDDFWTFCYKQPLYSIIYIDLLNKILEYIKDNNTSEIIKNKLSEIIKNFIEVDLSSINTENITDNQNYDDFCDNNKKFKNIRGKTISICWIILKTKLNIISKEEFFEIIKNLDLKQDIVLDILHIYNTLLYLDKDYLCYLKDYSNTENVTKKSKYKILDILENRLYKLDGFKLFKI
jgi:hypothetical protein